MRYSDCKCDLFPVYFFMLNNLKGENMKKVMLALFAVMTLAACTGSYKSGNCEYDFLLHKDISISKIIGNVTGGC